MKISGGCYCGEIKYEADGEPRAKIKTARYQNGASRPQRLQFRIKQVIHVSNQPVSSYLLQRGPAAGAKP